MTMVIRWVVLVVVAGLFGCNGEENADPPEAPIECNTSTWPGPLVPGPSSANLGTRVTYLCVGEDDCRVSNTSGTTCSEDAGVALIGYTSSGEPSDWWVTLADISAEGWAVTVGEETTDFVDSVREFGEFSVASISNLPSDSEVQLRLLRESDGARFHVYFGITGDWSDIHTEPTPDDLELTMRNFVVVEDVGVEYPALVTTTLDVDCELAMDDDGLYWLSHHSTDGSAARNWTLQANPVLHHTPALVGKTDVVTTLWTDTKTTRKFTSGIPQLAIATDDTHVYWTAVEDETVGVVWKADKATGDVTEVARDDSSDDATQPRSSATTRRRPRPRWWPPSPPRRASNSPTNTW